MAIVGTAAAISLVILAITMFYMAFKYREQARFGRFEICFTFGNIFLMAGLFILYLSLTIASDNQVAQIVFGLFQAVMWIYLIACIFIFFKMMKNTLWDVYKTGGKMYA